MDKRQATTFHRLATGLQIARNQNAYMRFMTLTSAPTQKHTLRKSLDILKKCIERATWKRDGFVGFKFNRYFCLRTAEGHGVLHIIFWGRYIPQGWLKKTWKRIHGAEMVDIRACWTKRRNVSGLVGYLLENYLLKNPIERMSYGWKWAWLGFSKGWKKMKDLYNFMRSGSGDFQIVRPRSYVSQSPAHPKALHAWRQVLLEPPPTSRQSRFASVYGLAKRIGQNAVSWNYGRDIDTFVSLGGGL